jgi:predicted RNA-binding protein with PUA-like domain
LKTTTPATHRRYWLFSADPHHYHWDTLFVKGKEMYRTPRARPETLRVLKQTRRGDRVLCYHSAPERSLYAIGEVSRDPYPDPHDSESRNVVIDLRAVERLPRAVALTELRANKSLRRVKFFKNVRLVISTITEQEYTEMLRMAGLVAQPGIPLP